MGLFFVTDKKCLKIFGRTTSMEDTSWKTQTQIRYNIKTDFEKLNVFIWPTIWKIGELL
jgi:hypothetical protein